MSKLTLSAQARQMASSDGHRIGSGPWWEAFREYRALLYLEAGEITQTDYDDYKTRNP